MNYIKQYLMKHSFLATVDDILNKKGGDNFVLYTS